MYNFDADIYNIDAHFSEGANSMVTFSSVTNLGSIVFTGDKECGKYSILGQIFDKFRTSPGSKEEQESKNIELRNVMFRFPIVYTSENPEQLQKCQEYFDGCQAIVYIIDLTKELNSQAANEIQFIRNSLLKQPFLHVFLHKKDILLAENTEEYCDQKIKDCKQTFQNIFKNPIFHETSLTDGSTLIALSKVMESVIPQNKQMHDAMDQFAKSLELSNCFLVDLQTRSVFLSGGEEPEPETLSLCQSGTEMFVSLATMMDAKTAQSVSTIELGEQFYTFFWSAFDVILVAVSNKKLPIATSKNNVMVLLNILKKILDPN